MTSDIASGGNLLRLTDRERQILSMLARGYANKEVARELNLSVRTIETHRLSLRRKAGGGQTRKDLFALHERVEAAFAASVVEPAGAAT